MRIINKTQYHTDQLRAFAMCVMDEELPVAEYQWKRKHVVVQFVYRKGRYANSSSGYAFLGGSRCVVRVPRSPISSQAKIDLVVVLAHEMAHLRGNAHRSHGRGRMATRYGRNRWTREHYAWAQEMPLEPMPVKPRIKVAGVELAEQKRDHAAVKVAAWEKKIRASTTRLNTWKRKVRYHEGRMAAMGASKKS